ncbi:MAG: hypothetical protein ACKV2U_28950 [Bryobacteraceae bacterium]
MRNLLGDFALDPESIGMDREVSTGLARAHQRQAEETPERDARDTRLLAAATEYRRAGAHSILLSDWERAREMFERAGDMYSGLDIPYGLMMYSFSRDPRALAEELRWFERPLRDRTQAAYLLLAGAAGGREPRPGMLEELASARSSPIGILGLPVGAYVDLAVALERRGNGGRDVEAAALPFLAAYSSAMARTFADSYHWGMMILPFHPAEPDILSVLFCAESVLRSRREGTLLDFLRAIPLFPPATDILYNAIAERFGDEH